MSSQVAYAQEYCATTSCFTAENDLSWSCTPSVCSFGGMTCDGTKDVFTQIISDGDGTCTQYVYIGCGGCGGTGGCFTGETPIKTPEGEKEIKDLNIGESIISVDPLTGEELQSKVENIYELEREGYYEVSIELPNGEKEVLKVTGEHPLYVKQEESNSVLSKLYTVFESIKKKLHHTF